uniref:Uncharacterized protein n=1 Tax=Cacopsylla melanoneura TaxID=428564 RepID=A0A8D8PS90_9HEMI
MVTIFDELDDGCSSSYSGVVRPKRSEGTFVWKFDSFHLWVVHIERNEQVWLGDLKLRVDQCPIPESNFPTSTFQIRTPAVLSAQIRLLESLKSNEDGKYFLPIKRVLKESLLFCLFLLLKSFQFKSTKWTEN